MAQSALKVVEMPTKKKPSFAAAMKATTTKAPAKKKTTMPTLEVQGGHGCVRRRDYYFC